MEDKQKPSVGNLKKMVVQYALRQTCDFDKYKALELIENLKSVAIQCRDKKADYYSTVHVKLLERISRPAEQFKSYVLSLLADRDYEKIIDAVAKVDKAFGNDTPSSAHLDLDMYGPTPSGPRFLSHSLDTQAFPPLLLAINTLILIIFQDTTREVGDLTVVHAIIAGISTIVLIIVSKRILIERQIWVRIRKILEQLLFIINYCLTR